METIWKFLAKLISPSYVPLNITFFFINLFEKIKFICKLESSMKKYMILLCLAVNFISCASRTTLRDNNSIAQTVATGVFIINGPQKVQLKLTGVVTGFEAQDLAAAAEKYKLEIKGPFPSTKVISLSDIKSDLTFEIDTDVAEGKYLVSLFSNKSTRALQTKEINVDVKHDRHELFFRR